MAEVQRPAKIVDVNSVTYLYAKLKSNIDQFQDSSKTAIDQFKSDAQTSIDSAVLLANNATSDAQAAANNANQLVKDANGLFLSKVDAQNTYLRQSSAAEIYQTQSGAANTYLSKTDASNTYLGKGATAVASNKLATARNIAISGAVTGNANFDGSGNITISTTTNHSHSYAGSPSAGGAAYENYMPRVAKSASYQPGNNIGIWEEFSPNSTDMPTIDYYHIFTGQGPDCMYNTQLALGMTTTNIAYRNRAAGTWAPWQMLLTSGNYTSYAPTKTGGGASGTWGISVSGNAATATKLATARNIALGNALSGSANFDGSGNITISANVNKGTTAPSYLAEGSVFFVYE